MLYTNFMLYDCIADDKPQLRYWNQSVSDWAWFCLKLFYEFLSQLIRGLSIVDVAQFTANTAHFRQESNILTDREVFTSCLSFYRPV